MSDRLLLWAVGPDPEGRWHIAVAPRPPVPELTTAEPAVCGHPPAAVTRDPFGQLHRVWRYQTRRPDPQQRVCALCAKWAEKRHDVKLPRVAV